MTRFDPLTESICEQLRAEVAEFIFKWWDIERFYRHIKTTSGLVVRRCQAPAIVRAQENMAVFSPTAATEPDSQGAN